ncbi:ATPase family AAA domain-containing protein 1-A-like [Dorcoceras hygrometricum]|uniref:ATPase family AAA domain-containing protein 1-A-like n=1 Tax=Dorcoceras hygrometricum TaxID=472368 RepID=A0A2Z7A4N9_9LAMI|nr:ATPase family AAA domain-containing protein 1-A-like [Dorcoceras hygrometricum]
MALMKRLGPCWRMLSSVKTLNLAPSLSQSPRFMPLVYNGACDEYNHANGSEGSRPLMMRELVLHTILAGLFGFKFLETTHADSDERASIAPPPPESPPIPSHQHLEEIAKREKLRLVELLKSKGGQYGFYPRFTVAAKGEKVTFRFQVPLSCEIPLLITNLVSRLGVKANGGVGSDMIVQAWDSGVAWQLTLSRPNYKKGTAGDEVQANDTTASDNDGELHILIFRPHMSSDKAEIEFSKQGSFTLEELDSLASALQLAGQQKTLEARSRGNIFPTFDKTISSLEAMGVKIYGLAQPNIEHTSVDISWDNIAGYDDQKQEIEDTILLALKRPEVYDDIARGTRCTGKTSCARVIAYQAGVPLLYVPLEVIMSKYYGESERLLGQVFSLAKEIPNGAIVFLDEVDSVATARDSETHEATRRLLSVLLRQIDGFEQDKEVVVVAATNRKQDLDPALLSRFDSMIAFGLPDHQTRQEIAAQYAKHLSQSDLAELASATAEMSGRDIRDVCQQAERHWASKIIRAQKDDHDKSLPPLEAYIRSALKRQAAISGAATQSRNQHSPLSKKPQFDFL